MRTTDPVKGKPMRAVLTLIALCAPFAARAACQDETVLFCTLSGGEKVLEVCLAGDALTYSYGSAGGKPEISLSEPLSSGTYLPWNGVGRAIWEAAGFRNEGYLYEAWTSVDRLDPDAGREGGVSVTRNDEPVANLVCDPGTVEHGFELLYDAMEAQGYCYDRFKTFAWKPAPCE